MNQADKSWGAALRGYLEPRLIAVMFLGFSSGLPLALTGATLQIRQTEAGVDLTTIGFFALAGVSYSLKFLWSPLIDKSLPPGPLKLLGHRRGWAILFQILLVIAITALGMVDPTSSQKTTVALAIIVAFLSASQDIVIDAYRIELLDKEQQGAGSAMIQYGYRIGMLTSGAGALFIAEYYSWFAAYAVMAIAMGVGILTVLIAREPKHKTPAVSADDEEVGAVLRFLTIGGAAIVAIAVFMLVRHFVEIAIPAPKWLPNVMATLVAAVTPVGLFLLLPHPKTATGGYSRLYHWLNGAIIDPFRDMATRQGWVSILLFIVLFKLGDAVCGAMANPFYISIGFQKPQIAEISKVFGLVATFVGVFLGGLMNLKLGLGRTLVITGLLQLASNLMFSLQAMVGNDEHYLYATIGIENLTSGMGSAAFVAYLSGLCNLAFTATQYALFSSLAAVGRTVLSSPFGAVAEDVGWVNYFLISAVMAVPGMLLLFWMLKAYPAAIASGGRVKK